MATIRRMGCSAEESSLMIGYQHFRPTSAEVRRERKRIAQRKYRNSLRLRSEVAQLNDTCEAGDGEKGWRVDLDRKDCEAKGSTSREPFQVEALQRANTSFVPNYPTVDLQKSDDEAAADWCCVGNGRDSLSPTNTIDVRNRHLQLQRKTNDCLSDPAELRAGRQSSGRSSISAPAQPLQSIMFQMADNGGYAAVENMTDCLQDADETLEFANSGVDEMVCGQECQESPVSSRLSQLSLCQPEALASIKSAGPLLACGSGTAALHDTDFGMNSPAQNSTTTTAAGNDYGSIRVPSQKRSRWDRRGSVRDDFAESGPSASSLHSPDLTLHKRDDPMTTLASITAPIRMDSSTSQGMSPLFQAAMAGNVKILSIMVHNSVYPEMVNQDGQTILHIAAQNGHCDEVEFLISFGFDVNARDHGGNTALHLAVSHGWEKMVEVLVDAGADVDGLNYK
ncbi:hypothetical protein E4U55_003070 [Claviceps digitariae]|nr:hypothetical protein E4U55_003070 [Claviceps digitariae]